MATSGFWNGASSNDRFCDGSEYHHKRRNLCKPEAKKGGQSIPTCGRCDMSVEYAIDPRQGVVFRWWRGTVTPLQIVDNAERLRNDPLFNEHYSELVDMSTLAGTSASSSSLSGIARKADPFSAASLHAVVAPGTAAFGIARMYQTVWEGANCAIFRSREEACAWLGVA